MRILRVSIRRKRINVIFFSERVEIDGEFSDDGGLIIDRDVYERSGYAEGDDLSLDDIEQLSDCSRRARAYPRGLWLLDSRDYTRKGMFGKLKALYGEDAANYAADRLCAAGFIDDERFAERAARFMLEANRSQRDTVSRLVRRGVPYAVAGDVTARVAAEEECDPVEQIKLLIDKKFSARLTSGDRNERQRVIAAIARKGFDFDDIRSAVSAYCDELFTD